jgi:hypothetical protein
VIKTPQSIVQTRIISRDMDNFEKNTHAPILLMPRGICNWTTVILSGIIGTLVHLLTKAAS